MKHKLLSLIMVVILIFSFTACQKDTSSSFPDETETYSENISALGSVNRFAGVVTSSGETKIEKDETKTVSEVLVSVGDDIKEGQLLFTYDSEQAQLNYDKATLELDQLNYTLQSYNEQKNSLEAEKANAGGSEQLSYTLQIQEIDTSIRETTYNIGLKEKEVEKLATGLEDLEIKSPINGKVQSINTEDSMDRNGSSLPFMVLMNTGTYRVMAYINELNAQDLVPGDEVTVRSRVDDSTWQGVVSSIDWENPVQSQEDSPSDLSSSSKYPLYVELDNADGLILGQHVFIEKEMEITYEDDAADSSDDVDDSEDFETESFFDEPDTVHDMSDSMTYGPDDSMDGSDDSMDGPIDYPD